MLAARRDDRDARRNQRAGEVQTLTGPRLIRPNDGRRDLELMQYQKENSRWRVGGLSGAGVQRDDQAVDG